MVATNPVRILTWHVHGSYLYYLAHAPHEFYVPVKPGRPEGYGGRADGSIPWPDNVHEVPADEVCQLPLDCILFNSRANYLKDQYEILSPEQRRLPRIFLEHDPPRQHPTDTRHVVDDPQVLLVHVTPFNELMWDSGQTPTRVIQHGVRVPAGVCYTGELARGIVVINALHTRGRRLGQDVFERVRREVPLDLVGIGSERLGGLGEIPHAELPRFISRYRFLFNPVRYSSLGLAVCEAMMVGMPVVGLATAEMVTVVRNGESGFLDTDVERLIPHMHRLLSESQQARVLGLEARRCAERRFGLERFVREWSEAFTRAAESRSAGGGAAVAAGAAGALGP